MKMSMLFDLSTPMQLHVNTLTIVFRVNNLTMILRNWSSDMQQYHLGEMVRKCKFLSLSPDLLNQALRVGPRHLCFNKPSGWFWCVLKFETTNLKERTNYMNEKIWFLIVQLEIALAYLIMEEYNHWGTRNDYFKRLLCIVRKNWRYNVKWENRLEVPLHVKISVYKSNIIKTKGIRIIENIFLIFRRH